LRRTFQINIYSNLVLQPEITYSLKGYKFPATQFNSEGIIALNYICFTPFLGYLPNEKVTLLLGPEVGFLTSAHAKSDNQNIDVSRSFQKIDIGATLGMMYEIKKWAWYRVILHKWF